MGYTYTKANVRSIVEQIDIEAKQAGLLPMDHRLQYEAGNTSYHVQTRINVLNGENQYVTGLNDFLPEFSVKAGPTQQYTQLQSTLRVFHALRKQREAAAEAAREQLANR